MRAPAATILGRIAAALVLLAGLAAIATSRQDDERRVRGRAFHALLGGLGTGAAIDLAACEPAFDARVGSVCPRQVGPVPGAHLSCPRSDSGGLAARP